MPGGRLITSARFEGMERPQSDGLAAPQLSPRTVLDMEVSGGRVFDGVLSHPPEPAGTATGAAVAARISELGALAVSTDGGTPLGVEPSSARLSR
jgi:hypothetical protein